MAKKPSDSQAAVERELAAFEREDFNRAERDAATFPVGAESLRRDVAAATPHGDAPQDDTTGGTFASILLEDGNRVTAAEGHARAFRVRSTGGSTYEHCGEAAGGEWVYRLSK